MNDFIHLHLKTDDLGRAGLRVANGLRYKSAPKIKHALAGQDPEVQAEGSEERRNGIAVVLGGSPRRWLEDGGTGWKETKDRKQEWVRPHGDRDSATWCQAVAWEATRTL